MCVCVFDFLCVYLCVQMDLHPSGKVMMVVQYFLEGGDTGKRKQHIFFFLVFLNLQNFEQRSFFPQHCFCLVLDSLACV